MVWFEAISWRAVGMHFCIFEGKTFECWCLPVNVINTPWFCATHSMFWDFWKGWWCRNIWLVIRWQILPVILQQEPGNHCQIAVDFQDFRAHPPRFFEQWTVAGLLPIVLGNLTTAPNGPQPPSRNSLGQDAKSCIYPRLLAPDPTWSSTNFIQQNTKCWREVLICWIYPPPSDSHHRDHYMFSTESLWTFCLWLLLGVWMRILCGNFTSPLWLERPKKDAHIKHKEEQVTLKNVYIQSPTEL